MSCKPACATCGGLRGNALEIVGADGADGVTLERLSAASGLPVAEISTHYATGAECVYETYDEVGCEIVLDLIDAFAEGTDWQSALELSNRRLLELWQQGAFSSASSPRRPAPCRRAGTEPA